MGVVVVLSLAVVAIRHLDKIIDINVTSWSLRRQGVDDKEIREIAIASAKRERRHIVLQVLDRIIEFTKTRNG